jgi:hypothetical protein
MERTMSNLLRSALPGTEQRNPWATRPESPGFDAATRAAMETAFGHDFSAVRVHTDERAGAQGARALTAGNDIHFAPGEYVPGTRDGTHLLAHELAHVVQQGGHAPSGTAPDRSSEQVARSAADVVTAGRRAHVSARAASGPQLEEPANPVEDGSTKVLAEGLKKAGEELVKSERVKKEVIEPVTKAVEGQWDTLSGGEKGLAIGFGVGALGTAGGALLSDPNGRKVLSGVNLAAPLALIPSMPLSTFQYTLPHGTESKWTFKTGFDLTELLKLSVDKLGGADQPRWKGLSLSADLAWDYEPATKSLRLVGGTGRLGLLPGLSISGGTYSNLLQPPRLFPTEGGFVEQKTSLPERPAAPGVPDMRVMLMFDFKAFAESGIIPGLTGAFGGGKKKK